MYTIAIISEAKPVHPDKLVIPTDFDLTKDAVIYTDTENKAGFLLKTILYYNYKMYAHMYDIDCRMYKLDQLLIKNGIECELDNYDIPAEDEHIDLSGLNSFVDEILENEEKLIKFLYSDKSYVLINSDKDNIIKVPLGIYEFYGNFI